MLVVPIPLKVVPLSPARERRKKGNFHWRCAKTKITMRSWSCQIKLAPCEARGRLGAEFLATRSSISLLLKRLSHDFTTPKGRTSRSMPADFMQVCFAHRSLSLPMKPPSTQFCSRSSRPHRFIFTTVHVLTRISYMYCRVPCQHWRYLLFSLMRCLSCRV